MAVDVYSENLVDIISPRISFSHDLEREEEDLSTTNTHPMPCRYDYTLIDSTPLDFAFNVDSTKFFPSSTADELFSNGRILPTGVTKEAEEDTNRAPEKKYPEILMSCLDPHPTSAAEAIAEPRKKSLKEFLEDSIEEEEDDEPNTSVKSFWMFRRSNSLNVDKKRLIGSWKILSRSGSTGKFLEKVVEEEDEADKPKLSFWKFSRSSGLNFAIPNSNVNNKPLNSTHFRRSSSLNCTNSGSNRGLNGSVNHLSRSNSTGSAPNQVGNQKNGKSKQIKNLKIYGYGNGNGKVSPVLNLPSPYISRVSVDLFGFGSLFCKGSRDRTKKKY